MRDHVALVDFVIAGFESCGDLSLVQRVANYWSETGCVLSVEDCIFAVMMGDDTVPTKHQLDQPVAFILVCAINSHGQKNPRQRVIRAYEIALREKAIDRPTYCLELADLPPEQLQQLEARCRSGAMLIPNQLAS